MGEVSVEQHSFIKIIIYFSEQDMVLGYGVWEMIPVQILE